MKIKPAVVEKRSNSETIKKNVAMCISDTKLHNYYYHV